MRVRLYEDTARAASCRGMRYQAFSRRRAVVSSQWPVALDHFLTALSRSTRLSLRMRACRCQVRKAAAVACRLVGS